MTMKTFAGGGGGSGGFDYNSTLNLYVDSNITVSGDGTQGDPYKTIQEALNFIQDATGKPTAADAISGAWTPVDLANYTAEGTPEIHNIFVASGRYDEDIWIGPSRNINLIAIGTVALGAGDLSEFRSTIARHVIWHTSGGYARSDSTRPHLRFTSDTPGEVSSTQPAADTGWIISGDLYVIQTASPGLSDHNTSLYIENTKVTGDVNSTKKSTLPINLYMKRFIVTDINIPNLGSVQLLESGEVDGEIIADYYGMLRHVEISKDLAFQNFFGALQPAGIFNCYFKKSGTQFIRRETAGSAGIAADLVLDATSLYWFEQKSGVLIEEDTGGGGRGVPSITLLQASPLKWDDLRVPITSTVFGGTKNPGFSVFKDNGAGSQGIFLYWFDKSLEEELYFHTQFPHSYAEGTDILPHVHWVPKAGGGAGQFVKWGLEYAWQNVDGTYGNTTIILSDASSAVTATTAGDDPLLVDKQYVTDLGTISGTGKTISSMIVGRVFRAATDVTDDYDADAGLLEIDFDFQNNGRGTDTP